MSFQFFVLKLVHSPAFRTFVMTVIMINTVTTGVQVCLDDHNPTHALWLQYIEYADNTILGIYTIEFVLKVYVQPRSFFYNGFNCFDFLVLLCSYLQVIITAIMGKKNLGSIFKVLRSLRALRPLRSLSFVGGLQVIVRALLSTGKISFVHISFILVLIMFVFGTMGKYLFGDSVRETCDGSSELTLVCVDYCKWGTLYGSMLSLWVLVTAEGWPQIETQLWNWNTWSRIYIISFLSLGHFVFSNLFVAVVIGQIDSAQNEYTLMKNTKLSTDLFKKKKKAHTRLSGDVKKMIDSQKKSYCEDDKFRLTILQRYGSMRGDEFLVVNSSACGNLWLQCFNNAFNNACLSRKSIQYVHREIAGTIAESLTKMKEECGEDGELLHDGEVDYVNPDGFRRRMAIQHMGRKPVARFSRTGCGSCFKKLFTGCICSMTEDPPDYQRPKSRLIEVMPATGRMETITDEVETIERIGIWNTSVFNTNSVKLFD